MAHMDILLLDTKAVAEAGECQHASAGVGEEGVGPANPLCTS
jgi:hypothetical protein